MVKALIFLSQGFFVLPKHDTVISYSVNYQYCQYYKYQNSLYRLSDRHYIFLKQVKYQYKHSHYNHYY